MGAAVIPVQPCSKVVLPTEPPQPEPPCEKPCGPTIRTPVFDVAPAGAPEPCEKVAAAAPCEEDTQATKALQPPGQEAKPATKELPLPVKSLGSLRLPPRAFHPNSNSSTPILDDRLAGRTA